MEKINEIIAKIDDAIYNANVNKTIDGILESILAFIDEKIPALRGGDKK